MRAVIHWPPQSSGHRYSIDKEGTQRYGKGAELLDFAGIAAIIDCRNITPATVAGRADSLSGREGGQVPWLAVLPLNMIRGPMT